MALAVLLLLGLFWSLVYCQTFPYVSFRGQTLPNHSYVDLSQVGDDPSGSDGVQCITDLTTCCANTDGPHRGDWYFPDGTRLPFAGLTVDTFEVRDFLATLYVLTTIRKLLRGYLHFSKTATANCSPWCSYSEILPYDRQYLKDTFAGLTPTYVELYNYS